MNVNKERNQGMFFIKLLLYFRLTGGKKLYRVEGMKKVLGMKFTSCEKSVQTEKTLIFYTHTHTHTHTHM